MTRLVATHTTAPVVALLCATAWLTTSGCSMFRGRSTDELASIEGIQGPTERQLQTVGFEQTALAAVESDPAMAGAKAIFDEGRHRDAEKAYKTILKRYRPDAIQKSFGRGGSIGRNKTADERAIDEYGSPVEQECLFMIAECQFATGNYPKAQESYERLLRRYPATPHLDEVTKRVYSIARHWLGFPPANISGGAGYEQTGDIQQVVHTDVAQSIDTTVAPQGTGWLNLTDGSKPTFDTTGRALMALKSIWLNDPTGPLADDALILTANHYYRNNDPIEASRYYELLREQYPDSPHLKNAYLLESHVKLTSYAGETYDDTHLDDAEQLKQASLQIFPDLDDEQKQRLRTELDQIQDARIAREWAVVELYRQKNKPSAVRLYCNAIINQYPDSQYAGRARQMLQIIAEEERNGGGSGWPFGRRSVAAAPALEPPATQTLDLSTGTPRVEPNTPPPPTTVQPTNTVPEFLDPFANVERSQPPANIPPAVMSNFESVRPAGSPGSIQQVGGTIDSEANPFAEFVETAGYETSSTEVRKPAVVTAAFETPTGSAGTPAWKPNNYSQVFEVPSR